MYVFNVFQFILSGIVDSASTKQGNLYAGRAVPLKRTSYSHGDGQTQSDQVEGSPFAFMNSIAHLTAKTHTIVLKPKVTAILQKTLW